MVASDSFLAPRSAVTSSRIMRHPPDVVWDRLVGEPESWLGAGALLEAVPGGRVSLDGHRGIVRRVEAGQHLSWEWSTDGDPGWSVVELSIIEDGGHTLVEVTEHLLPLEFESFPAEDAGNSGGASVPAGVQ